MPSFQPAPSPPSALGHGFKTAIGWALGLVAALLLVAIVAALLANVAKGPTNTKDPLHASAPKRVFIDPAPGYAGDYGTADRDAVQAAIEDWAKLGYDIQEVPSQNESNVDVQFLKEWGTEVLGETYQASFIQVGLGDSRCNDVWTPYAETSVHYIAAHEFGHALGLGHSPDPTNVMYYQFQPHYAKPCEIMSGDYSLKAGYRAWLGFATNLTAEVTYTAAELASGRIDVGIIHDADRQTYLDGGDVNSYGYHQNVNQASGGADLAPGKYALALQCDNRSATCAIHYQVAVAF